MTSEALSGAARYVGTRVNRTEDHRLLTGHGTFVDDVVRPGMLHARFVRSPVARASVTNIDTADALALPGVHAVLVAADLALVTHPFWFTIDGPEPPAALPLLADGEVRFVGDPVALVVAGDPYVAEDAAELVVVDYEPLPPVVDYAAASTDAETEPKVHPGGNLAGRMRGGNRDGMAAAAESAAHVIVAEIHQQAYTAAPIETRGVVAEWSAPTGELTVWTATQAPHEVRSVCARLLGLAEHQVRVIMQDTGGGFGQKVVPLREELCIAAAARLLPVPVKWIEDRRENLTTAGQGRHEHGTVTLAFDDGGVLLAASLDHTQDVGAYPVPNQVGPGMAVGMIFPGPYRTPVGAFSHRSVHSNTVGRTAYRGPWMFESVAREVTLDHAARQMGVDPVELRRTNMLTAEEMPFANPNGMPYSHMSPRETFDLAIDMLGYEAFRREQTEARSVGRYIGVGTCSYVEPTTPGYGYYASEGSTIRIDPSGAVTVAISGGSTGNSLETTAAQLAADALGVAIGSVRVVHSDTAVTPYGAGTGGSRSGSMIAGAVGATATVLRERLAAIAASQLEAAAEDIELAGGMAFVTGTPAVSIGIAQLASIAYQQTHLLPPGVPAGLEASERYTRASMTPEWANATHVCTCEVDVETGAVTILRYIVSEDCGPMINPQVVEGQIAGGAVQGIGGALLESLAYDADGNPLASTFVDYLIPSAVEAPRIEFGHVVTPGAGPGGYKGVGEGGAIGAPGAVINAVADALSPFGAVVSRLPLSPETVLGLVRGTA